MAVVIGHAGLVGCGKARKKSEVISPPSSSVPAAPQSCGGGVPPDEPTATDVTLSVDGTSFDFGQDLGLTWTNHLQKPIYLDGCATADLEYWVGSRWIGGGAFMLCAREGKAVRVDPGATYREPQRVVTAGKSAGYYRTRGRYWTGCQNGVGISHAKCTAGPIVRSTKPFRVPKAK